GPAQGGRVAPLRAPPSPSPASERRAERLQLTGHRGRGSPTGQAGRAARPARSRSARKARNAERSGSSSLDTGDGDRRPVRRAAQLGPRARDARAKPATPSGAAPAHRTQGAALADPPGGAGTSARAHAKRA